MKHLRLLLLLAFLPLLGCAIQGGQIVKVTAVKVAILPDYSLNIVSQKYAGLLSRLSEQTGYRLEHVSAMDYRSFLSTVEGSKADFSFQNALLFTRLKKTKNAEPIAVAVGSDGLPSGRGVIVVRHDSGIHSVMQLKGKTVAVPAREAVLGYLAQAMLLHESGLDVEEDMNVVVAARHDQVLSDVWQGKVDAGFVKESALDEVADRVRLSDLEVLAHTDPFPGWCVVKFPETDRVVADKMTRALLSLNWDNPNDRQALSAAGIRGFVDSSNVDLAPIRQAVDSLHLPY